MILLYIMGTIYTCLQKKGFIVSKFEYLPELKVELSDNYAVGVLGKAVWSRSDQLNTFYEIPAKEKDAKWLSWYDREKQKTSINVPLTYLANNGFPVHQTVFYAFPKKELYDEMVARTGVSTTAPVIVPPKYKTTKEVVDYVIKNKFNHDYEEHALRPGFLPSRLMQIRTKMSQGFVTGNYSILGNDENPNFQISHTETQKNILHIIVINEFIKHAIETENLHLCFEDYIRDDKNKENIVDKFDNFMFSTHKFSRAIKEYYLINTVRMPRHPMLYTVLDTVEKRKSLYSLTAKAAVDLIASKTGVRFARDIYPDKKSNVDYYDNLSKITIPKTTRNVREVLTEVFLSLDETIKETEKNVDISKNVFNNANIKTMSKIVFGARINNLLPNIMNKTNDREYNEVLASVQKLYSVLEQKRWSQPISLAEVLNAYGMEYVTQHMKPTDYIATCLLYIMPSKTLQNSSQLSNVTDFLMNNLSRLEKDDYINRDYIAKLVTHIVMNTTDVVASKTISNVDILDDSIKRDDVSTDMLLNVLFNKYINFEEYNKFDLKKHYALLEKFSM